LEDRVTRTPDQRRDDSRHAAHVMWSNTADRGERLRNAHDNSFGGDNWHARRIFGADVDLDSLTPEQWKQVDAARTSWFKAVSAKGVKARRLKAAQRLRDEAAAMQAAAEGDGDGAA
jgi:hypothetical protein